MKTFLSSLLLIAVLSAPAQSGQSEYLEAKRQFNLGNYATAQQSFSNLTEDDIFGAYASFYYALSALKLGDKKQAYNMWRQTQLNYPTWDQLPEVDYWLGYTAFAQKKYWEGFNHIEGLPLELKESLIRNEFYAMPQAELEQAYALNPDNPYIGSYLVKAIMKQPYDERDQMLLSELSEKYGVEMALEDVNLPMVKKEKYNIAAVLPFMFDSVGNPQSVIRNSIIFDLYLGMLKAEKELQKEGIAIDVVPFDTQKKADKTQELVSDGLLQDADVIVGPLYGGPNRVISSFSKENKVTMINPLSSNSEIIGGNPYSYLFKPSYPTQGRVAAEYAKQNFQKNKLACIYYETDRDSLIADAYRQAIEQDSFFIVRFERLTSENGLQIQRDFTATYEVRLDTLYSQEEMDSINLLPGRIVKTRPLRDEDDDTIIKDRNGDDVLEYYENRFTLPEDTIGHFFVATSSNLLANNFISLKEVRIDSIGVIGYSNWLDFTLMSYDQLERLEVALISPGFIDKNDESYKDFIDDFSIEIGKKPGEYHIIGYEMTMQLGRLLKENGKYFQRGLISGDFLPGIMMGGMQYGTYNDNQVVPVTKLENLQLIRQSLEQKEKEQDENRN